jgi:DMSO/TMAO reductase YedYZ molybdopterin-dependent catalytic subunit
MKLRLPSRLNLSRSVSRRSLLTGASLAAGGLVASNWRALSDSESYGGILRAGDSFNMFAQRLALHNRPLAKVYRPDQISAYHPSNGGIGALWIDAENPNYDKLLAGKFEDWRLDVKGLVDRPLSLSLAQLRSLPSQSQITMHSCDFGWSAIAEWTGVRLSQILALAGAKRQARYVVFHCLDTIGGKHVWGSLDLLDATHPQTILAYAMNGIPLPVGHGAPLRLRIELQIGYKNLKHLSSIELVDSLDNIGTGRGGIFEEQGYAWYAGL